MWCSAQSPFFFSSLLFFFFIFSLFFFSFHAFMAFIHGSFFHLHHCLHHCHDWIFGTCSGDLHTWHQDQLWSPSHFSLKFFSLFSKQNCKKKLVEQQMKLIHSRQWLYGHKKPRRQEDTLVAARAKHTDCTQRQDQQEGASPGNVWHTCMAARNHQRHKSTKAATEAKLNTDCWKTGQQNSNHRNSDRSSKEQSAN